MSFQPRRREKSRENEEEKKTTRKSIKKNSVYFYDAVIKFQTANKIVEK